MGKKMSDYMASRDDGLLLALKIVKEDGVEALEMEYGDTCDDWCGGFSYGYYNGIKDAIEIVEKGGIE